MDNGHAPAEYLLLARREVIQLDERNRMIKHVAERLSARIVLARRETEREHARWKSERGLLNVALHELARERAVKDPANFIRQWLVEHEARRASW